MVRSFDVEELDRAISAVHDGDEIDAIFAEACRMAGINPAMIEGSPLLALYAASAPEGWAS